MTPKEKAKELVDKYSIEFESYGVGNEWRMTSSKKHALIAVDEMISDYKSYRLKPYLSINQVDELIEYLEEVKQEVEAL